MKTVEEELSEEYRIFYEVSKCIDGDEEQGWEMWNVLACLWCFANTYKLFKGSKERKNEEQKCEI